MPILYPTRLSMGMKWKWSVNKDIFHKIELRNWRYSAIITILMRHWNGLELKTSHAFQMVAGVIKILLFRKNLFLIRHTLLVIQFNIFALMDTVWEFAAYWMKHLDLVSGTSRAIAQVLVSFLINEKWEQRAST